MPYIQEQLRNYDEAIAGFKKMGDSAGVLGRLGHVYAVSGHKSEAEQILLELQKRATEQQVGAYEVAFLFAALGQVDRAFEWLEKAYDQRDTGIMCLKLDPALDPLRSDPRLANLVQRVGLPQ